MPDRHPDHDRSRPSSPNHPPEDSTNRRAARSTATVFVLSGIGISSLLSRVPQIRDALDLSPRSLGLLLLMTAVGSLVSLPLSGAVVRRIGAARTVWVMAVVNPAGLALAAIGTEVGALVVGAGLFVFGFGAGQWDVAQNVEGAAVEQQLERSIMSRFHAAFSLGTVGGALVGAAMNALDVAPLPHLLVAAALVSLLGQLATRGFLPAGEDDDTEVEGSRGPWQAWREPRTLLIGVFVLCMAFAEGTGNDWLGVAAIDGYHTSDALGSFAYVAFVAAMTAGRWFGPPVLDRYGRVPVMRAGSLVAMVGVLVVVFGPTLGTAVVGIVVWGLGVALGFPTGMSAAADDPHYAAGRVSAVATIGYAAFLAGPSLIGVIGNDIGVLRALTVTAGVLAIGAATAVSTRPLPVEVPAR
jgi:predicted MFS family arabinose efflux permease